MYGLNQIPTFKATQAQQKIIDAVNKAKAEKAEKQAETQEKILKNKTKEFESLMIAQIMKQGLKTARKISESEDEPSNSYMDMAYDQLAEHIGKNSSFGLDQSIYESLKNKLR